MELLNDLATLEPATEVVDHAEQQREEWFRKRAGKFTCSQFGELAKSGRGNRFKASTNRSNKPLRSCANSAANCARVAVLKSASRALDFSAFSRKTSTVSTKAFRPSPKIIPKKLPISPMLQSFVCARYRSNGNDAR